MDRREFVGFVGGVLGLVGMPSAPMPAVESSFERLKRLVEARGGSVLCHSQYNLIDGSTLVSVRTSVRSHEYIAAGCISSGEALGNIDRLIDRKADNLSSDIPEWLASRGLI